MANKILQTLTLIEKPPHNSSYKKFPVQCLNEALCFVSSSVLADNFRLRNHQLLIAAKRKQSNCGQTFQKKVEKKKSQSLIGFLNYTLN